MNLTPPPPIEPAPVPQHSGARKLISLAVSLVLLLFLIDALLSVADDTLTLAFRFQGLGTIRETVSLATLVGLAGLYLLTGISPAAPKRYALPLVLFGVLSLLALLPCSIYFFRQLRQIGLVVSLLQLGLGLFVLARAGAGADRWWPLVPEDKLNDRRFRWTRPAGFALVNLLLVIPALAAYLVCCAGLAVGHLSAGFMALNPDGLEVQARKYKRSDGKTIQLIPMIHIAEPDFYREVSRLPRSDSVVLLEGVSDEQRLLEHKLSYRRMANSLGLAQQQETFSPERGQARHADVDVSDFSKDTIDFLKAVTAIHAAGLTRETIAELLQGTQTPALTNELWDDLLEKRNDHLVGEIKAELGRSPSVVVPWGAAHMPGLERRIQAAGFAPIATQEFQAVRFHTLWRRWHSQQPRGLVEDH